MLSFDEVIYQQVNNQTDQYIQRKRNESIGTNTVLTKDNPFINNLMCTPESNISNITNIKIPKRKRKRIKNDILKPKVLDFKGTVSDDIIESIQITKPEIILSDNKKGFYGSYTKFHEEETFISIFPHHNKKPLIFNTPPALYYSKNVSMKPRFMCIREEKTTMENLNYLGMRDYIKVGTLMGKEECYHLNFYLHFKDRMCKICYRRKNLIEAIFAVLTIMNSPSIAEFHKLYLTEKLIESLKGYKKDVMGKLKLKREIDEIDSFYFVEKLSKIIKSDEPSIEGVYYID